MLDEDAVAFKKTVFVWEAHLLQRAVLEKRRCSKTVFDWEAQLLQKALLDEEAMEFKRTVSTDNPSCSTRRCSTRMRWLSRRRCWYGRPTCSRGLC